MPAPQPLPRHEISRVVRLAIEEDLSGGSDITTQATIDENATATADFITRATGIVSGICLLPELFSYTEELLSQQEVSRAKDASSTPERFKKHSIHLNVVAGDGERCVTGQRLASVTGALRTILTAERSALNVVSRASGIATATQKWVIAVAGTGARIRDTRKTAPGLRALDKYAVRCGGGFNHRLGLSDQALIKDNHVQAAGGVGAALAAVRAMVPDVICEVECDTLDQVEQACHAGARLVLLDNMDLATTRQAVAIARSYGVKTEASGGLCLERAAAVAAAGVDYLAVGALTHSAPALDIGLDLRSPQ